MGGRRPVSGDADLGFAARSRRRASVRPHIQPVGDLPAVAAVGRPAFRGVGRPDLLHAGVGSRRKGGLCDRDLFADDDRLFVGQCALCRTARRHVGRSARTHGARRVQDDLRRRGQHGGRAGGRGAGEGFPAVGRAVGELDRGGRRRGRACRRAVLRDVLNDAGAGTARAGGAASGAALAARPAAQQTVADPCRGGRMSSGVQCVPGERDDLFLQVLRGRRNCRDDVVRRDRPDRVGPVPRRGAVFQHCGHRADPLRRGPVRTPADAGRRLAAHGRFQFRLLFRAAGRLFRAASGAGAHQPERRRGVAAALGHVRRYGGLCRTAFGPPGYGADILLLFDGPEDGMGGRKRRDGVDTVAGRIRSECSPVAGGAHGYRLSAKRLPGFGRFGDMCLHSVLSAGRLPAQIMIRYAQS